jgi:hypothetical protein
MRHQDLTLNHRLDSWIFADAAARNATGSYVTADVGRVAYQTNTGDYWRLLTVTPTWKRLNGAYASYQTVTPVSSATTAAVAPGVMAGMNAPITPTVTGKILVTISGSIINSVANKIPNAQIRWGTGTPPVAGAVGTAGAGIGGVAGLTGNIVNNASPFSLTAVITGAVIGTALWFDLAIWNTTTGGSALVGAR